MVDRQDIDALLIGSLYGELSSADEARLQLHLESHPADRTALDNLSRARSAVRASRIFQVQLEPPQSVSALLLQEAARRAPRKPPAETWFQRFVRSFLAHPAMATATMLVLVLGVAGTVYLRKGHDHLSSGAVQEEDAVVAQQAPRVTPMLPSEPPPPKPQGAAADAPATATGAADNGTDDSQYRVTLADDDKQPQALRKRKLADREQAASSRVAAKKPVKLEEEQAKESANVDAKPEPPKAALQRRGGPSRPLEVGTPERTPKDLDENAAISSDKLTASPGPREGNPRPEDSPIGASRRRSIDRSSSGPGGGAGAPPAADPSPNDGFASAAEGRAGTARNAEPTTKGRPSNPPAPAPAAGSTPPPPPPTVTSPTARDERARTDVAKDKPAPPSKSAPAPKPPTTAPAEAAPSPELAWARDQHARVVTQVARGNCNDAARLALTLSNRAPGYYEQNVQNDRQVRECLAYINAERDRETERTRLRASKRKAGDEPAKKAAPERPAASDQASERK